MNRWSQLSMSEKSDLMSLYIRNGISSLEEIKKHYNSFATGGHLYQDGGPDDPPSWYKPLTVAGTTPETSDNSVNYSPQAENTTFKQAVRRQAEVNAKVRGRKSPNQQDFNIAYGQLTRQEDAPIEQNFNPITGERQYTKEEQDLMRAQGAGLLTEGLFWALDPIGMAGYSLMDKSPRLFNSNNTLTENLEQEGISPVVAPFIVGGLGSGLTHGISKGVQSAVDRNLQKQLSRAYQEGMNTKVQGSYNSKVAPVLADALYKDASFNSDPLMQMLYTNYISGESTFGNLLPQKTIQTGLDDDAIQLLRNRTLNRNIQAIKEDPNLSSSFLGESRIKKLNEIFDKDLTSIKVGKYSGQDYKNAGHGDWGGFYNEENRFISINKDSGYPMEQTQAHEGLHYIDSKHPLTTEQDAALSKAFDDDFNTLPETEYASEYLKSYKQMRKERITTNRDARDKLLGYEDIPLEKQNQIIDQATDDAIFSAVENANGYGRTYIKRLRAENKLTHEKANAFRESMKKVGAITGIIGTGAAATQNKSKPA